MGNTSPFFFSSTHFSHRSINRSYILHKKPLSSLSSYSSIIVLWTFSNYMYTFFSFLRWLLFSTQTSTICTHLFFQFFRITVLSTDILKYFAWFLLYDMQTCVQLPGDWLPILSGDLGKDCAMQTCIFCGKKKVVNDLTEMYIYIVYIHRLQLNSTWWHSWSTSSQKVWCTM